MGFNTVYIITRRRGYSTQYWKGNGGWSWYKERAHKYMKLDAAQKSVERNHPTPRERDGIRIAELQIETPARGIVAGKEPTTMADNNITVSTPATNPIQEARTHAAELETRMNRNHPGGIEERALYEDRPFKRGMLAASIAQAEQLRRIADMLEGYLATYADPAVFAFEKESTNEGKQQ